MNLKSVATSWEQRLVVLAQDALCLAREARMPDASSKPKRPSVDAFAACETITARHSRSFYLASALLPEEKRRAMRVLYAFCRSADDLADGKVDQPAMRLREFRRGMTDATLAGENIVLEAWQSIRDQFQIPICYAEQLLDGVERDLTHHRYENFEDLSVYCYGVACTVGLMSMHITGFSDYRAVPFAIKLGVALQLTNILRDVREDWDSGRCYLPLDELAAFGLDEQAVAAGEVDERWRKFMRFQIDRARRLYAESMPGIALLHPDGRFAVAAAAMLYQGILDDIEAHDYNVFSRRAYVGRKRKATLLVQAYLYSQKNHLRGELAWLEDDNG